MRQVNLFNNLSKYFRWYDAIWLPTWNRPATENDGLCDDVLDRLLHLFLIADQVREFLDTAIIVHVAWRSPAYNKMIGGALDSPHMAQKGLEAAFDFHAKGITCPKAQQDILEAGKLDQWGMRMEDNGPDAVWIHLDTREPLPGHSRYFKP